MQFKIHGHSESSINNAITRNIIYSVHCLIDIYFSIIGRIYIYIKIIGIYNTLYNTKLCK